MTSRVLTGGESDQILSFGKADAFSSTLWNAPASRASGVDADSCTETSNCLRGAAYALGIEAAAALFFYAAWHLWLTIR